MNLKQKMLFLPLSYRCSSSNDPRNSENEFRFCNNACGTEYFVSSAMCGQFCCYGNSIWRSKQVTRGSFNYLLLQSTMRGVDPSSSRRIMQGAVLLIVTAHQTILL